MVTPPKGEMIVPESVVLLRAAVDKRGENDEYNLIVNEIIPLDTASNRFTAGVRIHLNENSHSLETLPRLNEILRGYPGKCEVQLALAMSTGEVVHIKTKRHRIDITPELRTRLDDLLGQESHRLIIAPPKLNSGGNGPPRRRSAE